MQNGGHTASWPTRLRKEQWDRMATEALTEPATPHKGRPVLTEAARIGEPGAGRGHERSGVEVSVSAGTQGQSRSESLPR